MAVSSYNLDQAAHMLGVSRGALQKKLLQGGFPGRFLAPGAQGPELRLPAREVEKARGSVVEMAPRVEAPIVEPPRAPSGLTSNDLEVLRDALLAIVREEREVFLGALRDWWGGRESELKFLREELAGLRRAAEAQHDVLERLERRGESRRPELAEVELGTVDVEGMLRELGELEVLIGGLDLE